ncbi:hypothetical protein PGA7_00008430 [Porphyromonas gingivalis]|nr:hypothetical protein PGA7_00008430 [Porphyromonas gingivalis]
MDKKQFCRCFFDLFFFFPKYTFFSDYYIILYSHGHGFYSCSLFNNLYTPGINSNSSYISME